jgi:DNA-binding MarR family transcriptional regulator
LSRRVDTTEPTTFAQIDRMNAMKLVERRRSREDRRKVLIHLTPHGRKLYRQLVPLAITLNEAAVEGFSKKEIAAVRTLLSRMQANLETHLESLLKAGGVQEEDIERSLDN